MKIRIDACVSVRVAGAVMSIAANRRGFDVSYVGQVHAAGTIDPAWISKFSAEDGTAIVSGDYNILQYWPDLIVYRESGLIGFFQAAAYKGLKGYGRAAFWIRWWPAIIEKIKESSRGDTWRLPMQWTPDITKFEELKDPRFGKDGKILSIAEAQGHRRS